MQQTRRRAAVYDVANLLAEAARRGTAIPAGCLSVLWDGLACTPPEELVAGLRADLIVLACRGLLPAEPRTSLQSLPPVARELVADLARVAAPRRSPASFALALNRTAELLALWLGAPAASRRARALRLLAMSRWTI